MKSEHRHELQTNELGKYAEKISTYIDAHGNRLMIGLCLACLPLAGLIYWWRTEKSAQTAAWRDFSAAINAQRAEEFHAVWQDHPGTVPAYWARVHEGEQWLNQGVQSMFRNVETGMIELKKARDAFQAVIDDRRAPVELTDRALLGLGRALESMSDGSEDEAIKAYERLVKEFPDSIYKKDAQERIAVLNRGSGQEFYAWFAKYPRPKISPKVPRDRLSDEEMDEKTREMLEKIESASPDTSNRGSEKLVLPETEKPEADVESDAEQPAQGTTDKAENQ
jgi:hypothetical protein